MSADIVGDLRRVEAERDALRAQVERVRALADDHEERSAAIWGRGIRSDDDMTYAMAYRNFARRIRAALDAD